MRKKVILLVEDDETLGYTLSEYLQMKNFEVYWAKDGESGIEYFTRYPIDICMLDVMMPKKDGFEVAKSLRKISQLIPIIFLTARSMKVDKLKGFNLGADDYITKPVDEEELIARIRAVLRRVDKNESNPAPVEYIFGTSRFNVTHRLLWVAGKKKKITEKESQLLQMLVKHRRQLVSREKALKEIWGQNDYFSRKSMDVHIYRLRKLLKPDNKISIDNLHGKGYILNDQSI